MLDRKKGMCVTGPAILLNDRSKLSFVYVYLDTMVLLNICYVTVASKCPSYTA